MPARQAAMTEIPERVVLDKLGTPDGSVYRIHAWQNGNLVVATVLPRDLALARLIDLGYEPDAATEMLEDAQTSARRDTARRDKRDLRSCLPRPEVSTGRPGTSQTSGDGRPRP